MPAPGTQLHRLTTEDVFRMFDAGVLAPEDRVELIDGVLVDVNAPGPEHSSCVTWLIRHFAAAVGDLEVRVQDLLPVEGGFVLPDLFVVDPTPRNRFPSSANLVVEVSVTTLRHDLDKARKYAGADVDEYWIIDVERRTVAVHREPRASGYASTDELSRRRCHSHHGRRSAGRRDRPSRPSGLTSARRRKSSARHPRMTAGSGCGRVDAIDDDGGGCSMASKVLCLPGGLCTAAFFDDLLAEQAIGRAGIELLPVTSPGFGGEPIPPGFDSTPEAHAEWAAKLARERGCVAVSATAWAPTRRSRWRPAATSTAP